VTALTRATIKRDGDAPTATEPPDSSLEFVAGHIGASHRSVRCSTRRRDSNPRADKTNVSGSGQLLPTIAAPSATAFSSAKARSQCPPDRMIALAGDAELGEAVAEDIPEAGLLAITSPDRLHRDWGRRTSAARPASPSACWRGYDRVPAS
jgi:hypothetical protein